MIYDINSELWDKQLQDTKSKLLKTKMPSYKFAILRQVVRYNLAMWRKKSELQDID